jgi:hypothetical protein
MVRNQRRTGPAVGGAVVRSAPYLRPLCSLCSLWHSYVLTQTTHRRHDSHLLYAQQRISLGSERLHAEFVNCMPRWLPVESFRTEMSYGIDKTQIDEIEERSIGRR